MVDTALARERVGKVTAFVVCSGSPPKLLVFRHPLAGVQLPAGTIEPGESVEDAAKREVAEETGVTVLDQATVLETQVSHLPDDTAVILRTQISRTLPDGEPGPQFQRGHRVSILERNGVATRVAEYEYDFGASPPTIAKSTVGWMPSTSLGSQLSRSFVLLRPSPATNFGRWSRNADGYEFDIFWTPLDAPINLVEGQQEWLTPLYRHLGGQNV